MSKSLYYLSLALLLLLPLGSSAEDTISDDANRESQRYSGWEWVAPFSVYYNDLEQDDQIELIADLEDPLEADEAAGLQGNLVVAPIPFSNPALGFGTALVGAYITKLNANDMVSPPSTFGLTGFYTENESYMGATFGRLYLKEDKYRLMYGIADGEINYKFYGIGQEAGERGKSIKLEQPATMGTIELLRQVAPNFYAGAAYSLMDTEINLKDFDIPSLPANLNIFDDITPEDLDGIDLVTATLGLRLLYDSRDHPMYPRAGYFVNFNIDFYDDAFGSDVDYETYEFAFNKFWSLSEEDVLGYRFIYRDVSDDAPFFALSTFGSENDLRGYEAGRYRDKMLYATQVEYRRSWTEKFGSVLFAGFGGVAPDIGDVDADDILPSAGAGIRYKLSEDHPLHYRVDVAIGKDDAEIYFGIGEAF